MNETPASITSATNKSPHRPLVIAVPAILIALLALGYFVAVPMSQIKDQQALAAKHRLVDDKLAKAYDTFTRDAFTKSNTTAAADKADTKVALDATKDARAVLNDNAAALTKFKALPLLSWYPGYRQAIALDAQEEQYVSDARAFLATYNDFLVYSDKSADLKVESDQAAKSLENVSTSGTPTQMADQIDAAIPQLQAVVNHAKALTPPAFAKAENDAEIADGEHLIAAFKLLADGARTLDIVKVTTASDQINHLTNDPDSRTNTFLAKLHSDSDIQKSIDHLRTLNTQIDHSYQAR